MGQFALHRDGSSPVAEAWAQPNFLILRPRLRALLGAPSKPNPFAPSGALVWEHCFARVVRVERNLPAPYGL